MSPRNRKPRQPKSAAVTSTEPLVVVCRGGDCGSRTKHPGTDHPAQPRAVHTGLAASGASMVASSCLDACDQSNVVVVVPGQTGQDLRGGPTWVGEVLNDSTTINIIEWASGGPAVAEDPVLVGLRALQPNPTNRHELDEAVADV